MIVGYYRKKEAAMGLIQDLIDANEEERREEYERLQGLSEKELLIEIVLLLEEIKHGQFFYSD